MHEKNTKIVVFQVQIQQVLDFMTQNQDADWMEYISCLVSPMDVSHERNSAIVLKHLCAFGAQNTVKYVKID